MQILPTDRFKFLRSIVLCTRQLLSVVFRTLQQVQILYNWSVQLFAYYFMRTTTVVCCLSNVATGADIVQLIGSTFCVLFYAHDIVNNIHKLHTVHDVHAYTHTSYYTLWYSYIHTYIHVYTQKKTSKLFYCTQRVPEECKIENFRIFINFSLNLSCQAISDTPGWTYIHSYKTTMVRGRKRARVRYVQDVCGSWTAGHRCKRS